MASSDLEKKAKDAFIDDHFQVAVDLYTEAINLDSTKAELFADRAQAHIKLNDFAEAVADSNKAIELDPSMSEAYFRKGTACMKLDEYETAKAAFQTGAILAPEDKRYANLIKECDQCIAEEAANVPKRPFEVPESVVDTKGDQPMDDLPNQASIATPVKPKFRHEFYQQPKVVVVTIFAKGVPASNVVVDFGEQILSVSIDIPGEEAYHFQPRLFGKIIPSNCKYEVLSTKVEIRLAKAEPIQWASLEFAKEITVVQRVNPSAGTGVQQHSYPSSNLQKVDWDKLEAEIKKEEKEEKLDGDAALNKFFREIYRDADEDMRRAMQKSFVESNGTVLSTNWTEVGSKKVEGSPPDGMELKKWEH